MEIAERDSGIVEAQLSAVVDELDSTTEYRYAQRLRGSRDALAWALGRRSEAPVSGRLVEHPTRVAISQENAWAYEVITGVRPIPSEGQDRHYAGGVEEALCWIEGDDDAVPVPITETEPAPAPTSPLARSAEEIEALYVEAVRTRRSATPEDYEDRELRTLEGSIDALDWLRGGRPLCPVTSTPGPATAAAVEAASEHYRSLVNDLSGPARSYGWGVQKVLSWVVGKAAGMSVV